MKIIKIRNVNWEKSPKVKAVLDIETQEGFVIKDCKLIDGTNGFFVASQSIKAKTTFTDKNGNMREWVDTIFIPMELRDKLNEMVANAYDPEGNYTVSQEVKPEMPF